jgi:hypothetical protein
MCVKLVGKIVEELGGGKGCKEGFKERRIEVLKSCYCCEKRGAMVGIKTKVYKGLICQERFYRFYFFQTSFYFVKVTAITESERR